MPIYGKRSGYGLFTKDFLIQRKILHQKNNT